MGIPIKIAPWNFPAGAKVTSCFTYSTYLFRFPGNKLAGEPAGSSNPKS